MIIGCLMLLRRMGAFPTPRDGAGDGAAEAAAATAATVDAALPPVPAWFSADGDAPPPADAGDRLRAGLWGVVRSLLRVLESGNLGKAVLDQVGLGWVWGAGFGGVLGPLGAWLWGLFGTWLGGLSGPGLGAFGGLVPEPFGDEARIPPPHPTPTHPPCPPNPNNPPPN